MSSDKPDQKLTAEAIERTRKYFRLMCEEQDGPEVRMLNRICDAALVGSAVRRMTPKQLDALRMLNDAFESHDGAPVMQAIITQADYRLLYEALAGGTTGDRIAQELLTPSATRTSMCVWEDCDQEAVYCPSHAREFVDPLGKLGK